MNQNERRMYLIQQLISEDPRYASIDIPQSGSAQRKLLRALMNVRPPRQASDEFLRVQDTYLKAAIALRGITNETDIPDILPGIALWRGDITTLACDGIVNAANSGMTGCYQPLHACIDNCIHTYAGIQLRLLCAQMMEQQGFEEPVGTAKVTPAFNLPCNYVMHTVGPMVQGAVTPSDESDLASCYKSCLRLAARNHLESVAFCCISTGVFGFPREHAARIAVRAVMEEREALKSQPSGQRSVPRIIFDVFDETDEDIYKSILSKKAQD